ncbi:MAG TPA: transcriptional regulator [Acetobacteraceae bacterium]|jgi:HTH-type transcriptional regulator/antitoxin HigA
MDVRPLKTEADYDWALAEAGKYFSPEPARGTPDGDRFEVLLALIENYETRHHAMGSPEPVAAIKVRMEEKGITRRQLSSKAGIAESKISEVLNYVRPLSLGMIRSLAPILDLPEAVLVPRYPLKGPARRTASGRARSTRQSGTAVRKRA